MIYAIVGPTCVGKTAFSIKLAKKIDAEIINCDSMQIYKELNIGVAKIKENEKDGVVHHLFNIVSINDNYSVFDYQRDGRCLIKNILSRGKNVVIVGGTGLYLKALLYDYTFDCEEKKDLPLYKFEIIGLTKERSMLYSDIDKRVDIMIKNGLLDEVKSLSKFRTSSRVLLQAIGYKELYKYLDGDISLDDAIYLIKKNSRHYAKRQYTFFNNQFSNIFWFDVFEKKLDEIVLNIL